MLFGLGTLLGIAAAVWIYNEEEGGEAIVWALLTFFFSAITLLVYGITRRSSTALLFAAGFVGLWVVQMITLVALHAAR